MISPEHDEFRRQVELLRQEDALSQVLVGDRLALRDLPLTSINHLLKLDAGYYFLIAAAGLNRSSLRAAVAEPETQVVTARQRRAYAVKARLPVDASFRAVAESAVRARQGDLQRKARGAIEQVFRDRIAEEGLPLFMSPPLRVVPGVVISRRKPDGVWPDPASGRAPVVYLEIKNIRRVADDIQKRLYELAEVSLEMKLLYGDGAYRGLRATPEQVAARGVVQRLRSQVTGRPPIVVGLLICPRDEAERYREGAEAFVDRIFFQEEIEDCITFLRRTIEGAGDQPGLTTVEH